nr:hypothetical protein [Tolivirales sp.]
MSGPIIVMKMVTTITRKGNGVVAGLHNTTAPKASKLDKIIGYLMRKRKVKIPVKDQDRPKIMYSRPAIAKLCTEVATNNRYSVLDMDLADREFLEVEETHNSPEGTAVITAKAETLVDAETCPGLYVPTAETAASTKVRVKIPKQKSVEVSACCDQACQGGICDGNQTNFPVFDKQLETLPRRLVAKLRSKKTDRFVYSQLLNFLRCKHFMHVRDTHFITTLVADARAWLLSKGFTMEDSIHYSILSIAVQQAFIVSAEELEFRATLKNPKIIDHIEHHNATMSGNLGRVNMFNINSGKHALAKAARRPFTRTLHLSAPKTDVV